MRGPVNPNRVAAAAFATLLASWSPGGAAGQVPSGLSASDAAAASRYVYWTNEDDGSVGRANINGTGTNQRFIRPVTANSGAGMAVNSRFIYWTGANGGTAINILRAKLDGTGVEANFIYTGEINPCGVTVNNTHIYWAGDGGSAIGRANINGTDVNPNFIPIGSEPGVCGVAVTSSHIYWANYRTGWIGRAYLDGTGPKQKFIRTLTGAGVAVKGRFIYWTDQNTGTAAGNSIGRAKLDGTGVNQNFIKNLSGPIAFLAVDSAHIYWADFGQGYTGRMIGRAKLDGTGVDQHFIRGTHGGFGIAVTAGSP